MFEELHKINFLKKIFFSFSCHFSFVDKNSEIVRKEGSLMKLVTRTTSNESDSDTFT